MKRYDHPGFLASGFFPTVSHIAACRVIVICLRELLQVGLSRHSSLVSVLFDSGFSNRC